MEQDEEPPPLATSWPRTVEHAYEWQAGTAPGARAGLVNALARSAEPSRHAFAQVASRLRRVSGAGAPPPPADDDDEAEDGGGNDDEEQATRAAGFGSGIEEEDEQDEDEDLFFPAEGFDSDGGGGGGGTLRRPLLLPAAAAAADSDGPGRLSGPSSRRRSFLLERGHPVLPAQPPSPLAASRQASLSAAGGGIATQREASVPGHGPRVPVRLLLEETDPAGSSSTLSAALNAANVLCGVGLLAMPYATAQAGWLSLLLLVAVAAVALFAGALLEETMSLADGPPREAGEGGALCAAAAPARPALLRSFPDLGGAAFGRAGRVLVALLLYLELLSCTVDFMVLEGDNLAALVPPGGRLFPSPDGVSVLGGALKLTRQQAFALLAAAGVLPTVLLRDLSALSYLSAGGILGSVAIVGCIFASVGAAGGNGGGNGASAAAAAAAPPPHLPLVRAAGLPVALGLYSFSFSGAACFPSIYVSMRDRPRFPSLLAGAFAAVAALYAAAAMAGVAAFGPSVSDQVTLSMRARLPDAPSTALAAWLAVLSPLTKIALTLAPVAMAAEELLLIPPRRIRGRPGRRTLNGLLSAGVRTALLAGCAAAAVSVPFFALLSQVIGAFMCLNISVVLPCLFYVRLRWRWAPRWALVAAAAVALAAETGSLFATAHAVAAIVDKYGA